MNIDLKTRIELEMERKRERRAQLRATAQVSELEAQGLLTRELATKLRLKITKGASER